MLFSPSPRKVAAAVGTTPAGLSWPRIAIVTVAKPPIARVTPPPFSVQQIAAVLLHSMPRRGHPGAGPRRRVSALPGAIPPRALFP